MYCHLYAHFWSIAQPGFSRALNTRAGFSSQPGLNHHLIFSNVKGDHGGIVVTLTLPPLRSGFGSRPQVGKLVVACRWSAVYSTET